MNPVSFRLARFVLVLPLICIGCAEPAGPPPPNTGYTLTHLRIGRQIPEAIQMQEAFSQHASHFIANYGQRTSTLWNSEVFFGGRYSLSLVVPIVMDYESGEARITGAASFVLLEYGEIKRLSNGNLSGTIGREWKFGSKDWKKICRSADDIDFSRAGITLNESGMDGFEDFVAGKLKDRVPIQLQPGDD